MPLNANIFAIQTNYDTDGFVKVDCRVCGDTTGKLPFSMDQNIRDGIIKKFRKWHEKECLHKEEKK